jgi:hypothetical protein
MPIALRVPEGGAQLNVISPDKAQPGQLYLLGFKGGTQGPIVLARQMGQEIQLGPLPENTDVASIERLALLPPIRRVEVEGVLNEEHPASTRVMDVILQHAATANVVLHF